MQTSKIFTSEKMLEGNNFVDRERKGVREEREWEKEIKRE